MPAYVIGVNRRTSDAAGWAAYLRKAKPSFPPEARVLAQFGRNRVPEGDGIEGVALFEFPSYEEAEAWYRSGAYQEAIRVRLNAADFIVYIVDGLAGKGRGVSGASEPGSD
jgi:uncharacterized protein (DUF1330 family)